MRTVPTLNPTTKPVLETKAMLSSSDVHVIVRPDSAAPAASRGVADSCTLAPLAIAGASGESAIDAIVGSTTVTRDVAVTPSMAATMSATPGDSAVTKPLTDTLAMFGAPLVHTTARPVITPPAAERAVAASVCVVVVIIVAALGVTVTVGIEYDLLAVRRKCRVAVNGWVV